LGKVSETMPCGKALTELFAVERRAQEISLKLDKSARARAESRKPRTPRRKSPWGKRRSRSGVDRRLFSAPKAKHWWRSRVDPFADAWPPLVQGWLIAEPSVPANVLMDRLAAMFPEAYASQAQLRMLQRRVKAWRAERVKEMVLGSPRKCADTPTEV
jgi:hypothetical protein